MNNPNVSFDFEICYKETHVSWVPAGMEYFFGVVGNLLALLLLWMDRRDHKWDSLYKLFLGLAITNFTGIFLVYPLVMKRYISNFTWCYSKALCRYVSFIFVSAHLSSALLVAAMTVDRYLNLAYQNLFSSQNEGRRYTFIIIGIWIFLCLFSMLHLVGVGESQLFYPGSWCYFNFVSDSYGDTAMSYLYSIIGWLIVFVTVLINIIIIRRMYKDPIEGGILLDARRVPDLHDHHVVFFLGSVAVMFCLLWTPLMVNIFLHATKITYGNGNLELWFLRLAVCNAIVNPWLYIVFRRKSLLMMENTYRRLRFRIASTNNEDETQSLFRDTITYIPDRE